VQNIVCLTLVTILAHHHSPAFADAVAGSRAAPAASMVRPANPPRPFPGFLRPQRNAPVPDQRPPAAPAPVKSEYMLKHSAERRQLSFVSNLGQRAPRSLFTTAGANFGLSLEKNGLTIEARRAVPAPARAAKNCRGVRGLRPMPPPESYEAHFAHLEFLNSNPDV